MEVIAQKRSEQGSRASRRLRRALEVPGVIYGGGLPPVSIKLNHNALYYQIIQEKFHASLLTLVVDGAEEKVLLRASQWHPFRQKVQHVDFQRVSSNARLTLKVPLHFINAEIAPGVKQGGGAVNHILNEVEVICLPHQLPEFLEVDLRSLHAGHSMHLSELQLPPGVELTSLVRGEDLAVVAITAPREKAEGE